MLTCYVKESSGPPKYVYWYKGDEVLNYSPTVQIKDFYQSDKKETNKVSTLTTSTSPNYKNPLSSQGHQSHLNNVQFVSSNKKHKLLHPNRSDLISRLSVENVDKSTHSGNYTCAPSNARSTSIIVHVVDGELFIP